MKSNRPSRSFRIAGVLVALSISAVSIIHTTAFAADKADDPKTKKGLIDPNNRALVDPNDKTVIGPNDKTVIDPNDKTVIDPNVRANPAVKGLLNPPSEKCPNNQVRVEAVKGGAAAHCKAK